MLSSGRLAAAIRSLAAVVAVLALGACGGDDDEAAADADEPLRGQIVETIGSGGGGGGAGGGGGGGGEDGPDEGGPCDEAPCRGPVYRRGGRVFLCGQLEVLRVPVRGVPAVTDAGVVEPSETEPLSESVPPPEDESDDERVAAEVLRPRCVPGTREIPVEGLDVDALAGVETSSDGEAAWTTTEVEIRGRIVDGTLVVAE